MVRNTLHRPHIFIFSRQLFCTWPWQMVPLINQQRCPTWNSHAGQFALISLGHLRITQQALPFIWGTFCDARRNKTWRSACTGMFLHPCSKLCIALSEVPKSCAICCWVFPKWCRISENSFFPIWKPPFRLSLIIPQSGWMQRFLFPFPEQRDGPHFKK